jgi:hypothetical protein
MPSEEIKSGSQVVSEFLELLQGDQNIDGDTLDALRNLFKTQKLTKTRLLKKAQPHRYDCEWRPGNTL